MASKWDKCGVYDDIYAWNVMGIQNTDAFFLSIITAPCCALCRKVALTFNMRFSCVFDHFWSYRWMFILKPVTDSKTLLHQKVCSCDWGKLFLSLLEDNTFTSLSFIISIFKFCEAAIVKLPLFAHVTDMGKLYFMYCGPSRIMTGRWWLYSKHKSTQVCGRQVLISMQSKNISVCSHHDQTALNSLTCKCEKTFLFVWLTHKATVQSLSQPAASPSLIEQQKSRGGSQLNSAPLVPPLAKWYTRIEQYELFKFLLWRGSACERHSSKLRMTGKQQKWVRLLDSAYLCD